MKAEVVKEVAKEEVKKSKLTIGGALALHAALVEAKVVGLPEEQTIKYLELKIALSDIADSAEIRYKKIDKECIPEGVKEGDNVPREVAISIYQRKEALTNSYENEPCDIDTHVLTAEELYKHILSIELNNGIKTEHKAVMLKYLRK